MDEDGIKTGADWMAAIGDAIEQSSAMVCVIDPKYTRSKFCINELTMAQSLDLQLFPILFREMAFDKLPPGLRYGR